MHLYKFGRTPRLKAFSLIALTHHTDFATNTAKLTVCLGHNSVCLGDNSSMPRA
ncbi:hypothetical protein EZS27_016861 [termite gut metagenome]|uniref:Uncharacterized protein n=1 Tax=termite gut metagenome TaxID=433724 RepID=A0A5J4RMH7_9ZZZZ